MGPQSGHTAFEEAVFCSKTFCARMRVLLAQKKNSQAVTLTGRLYKYDPLLSASRGDSWDQYNCPA
jgi:hypothetical protein